MNKLSFSQWSLLLGLITLSAKLIGIAIFAYVFTCDGSDTMRTLVSINDSLSFVALTAIGFAMMGIAKQQWSWPLYSAITINLIGFTIGPFLYVAWGA